MIQSKVRQTMENCGMSIGHLSRVTGLSTHTIMRSRGEAISRCTLTTLKSMARALGCQAKDLFEEEHGKG